MNQGDPDGSTPLIEAIINFHFDFAAFLLAQTRIAAYAARVGFVALTGLAAGITTNVSYWNWYGFPTNYTVAYASMDVVGFVAAGLAIAAIVKPRHNRLGT